MEVYERFRSADGRGPVFCLLAIVLVVLCVVVLGVSAFYTATDTRVVSKTPVSEYSGSYTELERASSEVRVVVYATIVDGEQTASAVHKYSGAYEVGGYVYEIDESAVYLSGYRSSYRTGY